MYVYYISNVGLVECFSFLLRKVFLGSCELALYIFSMYNAYFIFLAGIMFCVLSI